MFNFQNSYTKLPKCFFSEMEKAKFEDTSIIIFNNDFCKEIDLNIDKYSLEEKKNFFLGNFKNSTLKPFSQAYSGHQFGHFTNLGDGRAMILGEHVTSKGNRLDVQLKGSGLTPYSRQGDGKATLGPMLREYIVSEAMNALGVPTTRGLSVVLTNENIFREKQEKGAILTRVAKSHIRVGTFQYAAFYNDKKSLRRLFEYTVNRHYPQISKKKHLPLELLSLVIEKQATLVANWMSVGFIHGVMNTDNTTLSGETIDYGPCAFMDEFNFNKVFSSIDMMGRYSYKNQPTIMQWNLARFAETLLPLLDVNKDDAIKLAEERLNEFFKIFDKNWYNIMRNKLGLFDDDISDKYLISELFKMMEIYSSDFTKTFTDLTYKNLKNENLYNSARFKNWYSKILSRRKKEGYNDSQIEKLMQSKNPSIIPRNHIVNKVISEVENSDLNLLNEFMLNLLSPFKKRSPDDYFSIPPKISERISKTFCGT